MQTMRDKWTDERLDDLNAKVDRGFEEVKAEIRALRAEMNARFEEMSRRFDAVDRKFDAQNRTMLWFAGALIVAILASNLGLAAAILAS
jgi:tetrahydromethanopterin S-methyltransferase subunit G